MPDQPTDHAGLETLPFHVCLRLLASVPIGRVGFYADGEVVLLPVNHAVDGQDVVFRTAAGSKLTAAQEQELVAFEADDYDLQTRSGWSILITGRAAVVYDEAEVKRLNRLNLHPWAASATMCSAGPSCPGRRSPAGTAGPRLSRTRRRPRGCAARSPSWDGS